VTIRIKIRPLEPLDTSEHSLLVYLKLSDDDLGTDEEEMAIQELDAQLERLVLESAVGRYEESVVGGGYYKLFMYGPDADQIFEAVLPTLFQFPAAPGSFLVKGYGPNGSARVVQLETGSAIAGTQDGNNITIERDADY